jgi:hypothetical protein
VYNEGDSSRGFAICLKCGFADSEPALKKGKQEYPNGFEQHAALHDKDEWKQCWKTADKNPDIRNQVLAARETTDVLMLDLTDCTRLASSENVMLTVGYAMQRSGAKLLELDTRELGVMITPARKEGQSLGIVLYDTAAGGAGHVFELMKMGRPWLEEALSVLTAKGDSTHDQRCDHACLDCILSFDNQLNIHSLDRRAAATLLSSLLAGDFEEPLASTAPNGLSVNPSNHVSTTGAYSNLLAFKFGFHIQELCRWKNLQCSQSLPQVFHCVVRRVIERTASETPKLHATSF